MSEPLVGEIRAFPFGQVLPNDWLECNGQLVSIDNYDVLYVVIGTAYPGGDGVNTFAVPDLRARAVTNVAAPGSLGNAEAPAAVTTGFPQPFAAVTFAIAYRGQFPQTD